MKNSFLLRNAIVATAFTACASQSLAQTKTNPEIGQPFHLTAQIAVADRLAGYPVNSGDTIKVALDSGKTMTMTMTMTLLGATEDTSSYGAPIAAKIFSELGEAAGGCRVFVADLKDVVTSGIENMIPGEKTYASICYINASFDTMPKATRGQLQAIGIDKTTAQKYEQSLPSILPKEIVILDSLRPIFFNTAVLATNEIESSVPKVPYGTPVTADYAPGNQQIKYGPGLKPPAP
jgi:hypothetical protein